MIHKEYIRIVPNSNTAVLFIHGILGTPNHFTSLLPLVPDTYSIYNMLLDGHGGDAKAFSNTSMKKWVQQVTEAVNQLSQTHNSILIVAHSMGTLLAIEQAIQNPKVTKLFLLAMPVKISIKPSMFFNSMKVYFNLIDPKDLKAVAAKECCGIEHTWNILRYLGWIPRFMELSTKINSTNKILSKVRCNCFVFQSANDEMVSKQSIQYLQKHTHFEVHSLEGSSHFYYTNEDHEKILNAFKKFINL